MAIKVPPWPLIGDLFDARARSTPSELDPLDVFKVTLPVLLGSLLTFEDFVGRMLSAWTSAALYVQAAIPVVLFLICCHLIMSRKRRKVAGSIGFGDPQTQEELFYRSSQPLRVFAKVVLLPLFLIASIEVWGVLPNYLSGRTHLAGYLCETTTGRPLSGATIKALDKVGAPVSEVAETVDDAGFFYLDLHPWKVHPWTLEAVIPHCQQAMTLQVNAPTTEIQGCPGSLYFGRTPNGTFPTWRVPCLDP